MTVACAFAPTSTTTCANSARAVTVLVGELHPSAGLLGLAGDGDDGRATGRGERLRGDPIAGRVPGPDPRVGMVDTLDGDRTHRGPGPVEVTVRTGRGGPVVQATEARQRA